MIIRFILIAFICVLFLWFLQHRINTKTQAWGKIGAVIFFVGAVIAVLFPDTTNDLAHEVGVGRGADLLLYALTVAFLAVLLLDYIHRQDSNARVTRLARKVAILEANQDASNAKQVKRYRA
jgi:small membrane protein